MTERHERPPAEAAQHDDITDAGELYRRAVEASRVGRSAEATKLSREALRALPVASGNPEATALRINILAVLAYAEAETGTVADGLVYIGIASDLVGALPDDPRRLVLQGLVANQYALILLRTGRTTEAIEVYNKAIPALERASAIGAGDPELLARTYLNRGLSLIDVGRLGPAELDLMRCIAESTAYPVPRLTAKAQNNLGDIAQLIGDIPGALRYYEDAVKTFREIGPGLVPRAQIDQARALLAAGLADEAARQLDEALPVLRMNRISQDLAEAEVARAAAALLQGELELARDLARSAHRRFVKRGSGPWAEVAARRPGT